MEIPWKFKLPDFLSTKTVESYLVGGSVRDLMMGKEPADFDVCVNGNPRVLADLLAQRIGARVVGLGKKEHKLYRVVGRCLNIDIAEMQGRHIQEDLKIRDFTINALAYPLNGNNIIDPVGGLRDLCSRIIRMINPQVFDLDPLRLLRAHRMAGCLGFQIDASTLQTISQKADLIQQAAGERIWNELSQILATPISRTQITAMSENGLLTALMPELAHLRSCPPNHFHALDALEHTLAAYTAMENILTNPGDHLFDKAAAYVQFLPIETRIMLKLSILLHDIGKPATHSVDEGGRSHFYGHAAHGAALSRKIANRLRMAARQANFVEFIVRYHHNPILLRIAHCKNGRSSPRAHARFFRKHAAKSPLLLIHALADETSKTCPRTNDSSLRDSIGFLDILLRSYFEKIDALQKQPRLLNGHDLISRFCLSPSPLIGHLLKSIETARLAGMLHNRDEAFDWVEKLLDQKKAGCTNKKPRR